MHLNYFPLKYVHILCFPCSTRKAALTHKDNIMAKKTVTKRKIEISINPYELMLILNPELRETEVKKKLKEITDMIEKAGGKITNEDFWGKKPLAYRLKKNWNGIYMVYNMELPNNFLVELKEHLRIEKEVLRSMISKLYEGYTYTNYDVEVVEKRRERKPRIRKTAPKTAAEEPAKEEVKSEPKTDVEKAVDTIVDLKKKEEPAKKESTEVKPEKEKSKAEIDKYKSDLDKKLDAILDDEDLNL